MSETMKDPGEALRKRVELVALDYHKRFQGEYGCPGVTCPAVQLLAGHFIGLFAEQGILIPGDRMRISVSLLRQIYDSGEAHESADVYVHTIETGPDGLKTVWMGEKPKAADACTSAAPVRP